MAARIPKEVLWRLRNEVDIHPLIQHFGIPWKKRAGQVRFLCPICRGFHTAIHPRTNLARCFDCAKNFNPIDLTMLEKECSFLEAVRCLKDVLRKKQLTKDHRLS